MSSWRVSCTGGATSRGRSRSPRASSAEAMCVVACCDANACRANCAAVLKQPRAHVFLLDEGTKMLLCVLKCRT
ncbi:hypothetical protein GFM01_13820 [Rhizobium laguerreae]|nr:hypothetical protein [Rhizobium laguerreae]